MHWDQDDSKMSMLVTVHAVKGHVRDSATENEEVSIIAVNTMGQKCDMHEEGNWVDACLRL